MFGPRRLALPIVLALSGVIPLATAASADLMPAGNYRITDVFADTFVFTPGPPFTEASVFVEDKTTQSNPMVGPITTTTEVDVSVFWSGQQTDGTFTAGSGCSILPNPQGFSVGSGLTGASLHASFDGTQQPCNTFEPPIPTVTVAATWTATGTAGSGRTNNRYVCGAYGQEALTFTANANANSNFTLSALPGSFTNAQGFLQSSDSNIHAQGSLASTCAQPGTKGAGPGPQAPGTYTTRSLLAGFGESFSNPSSPQINIFVNRFTNISSPQGGPPTTTSETDVNLGVFGNGIFAFGCFVLQPSDTFTFSSDLSSASLHATIDPNVNPCKPAPPFPFPFATDVNVTWTGIGPVATSLTNSEGSCSQFSEELAFRDTNNNATATATLSFFPSQTFNGDESDLQTINHTFHIQGVSHCPTGH